MQKEIKKNMFLSGLIFSLVFLTGCGAKNIVTNEPMQKQTDNSVENIPAVKTPAPTGEVDATVDAIIDGADSEKTQIISDETEVKTMLDDSVDSNNLSKTYEQEL